MKKKFFKYFVLILFAVVLGNGSLSKFLSFLRQRYFIITISNEELNICLPLQDSIEKYIYNFRNNISINLLTADGKILIDINGMKARIPASNQKILSSAYSLDTLGPNYKLNTILYKLSDGNYFIEANGDPDFNKNNLELFVKKLKPILTNEGENKNNLILLDDLKENWWPDSWTIEDKEEEYGAPITRYSLSSNASKNALLNPRDNFAFTLESLLRKYKLNNYYNLIYDNQINFDSKYSFPIIINHSAPLYVLLNLVNSESHNFTSEVIFRNSIGNWSSNFPTLKYNKWMKSQNFNSNKFVFADASGLSRDNRVTTYGITQLLRRMSFNRYSDYFFSSFSILGLRGTLSNIDYPENLKGKILAKSGTLKNVKSISGVFLENGNYFSIIVNNMDDSLRSIINILSIVDKNDNCN